MRSFKRLNASSILQRWRYIGEGMAGVILRIQIGDEQAQIAVGRSLAHQAHLGRLGGHEVQVFIVPAHQAAGKADESRVVAGAVVEGRGHLVTGG